jgi:glycosyltransferase involved in cell wall biosynthesis
MQHERQVIILSDVSDDELPVLYRHCQFFVYPSIAEGFGMPPLEAMASGVPVISSNTTAMSEIVSDSGLLIDPSDGICLKLAIEQLLGNADLRLRLCQSGIDRANLFTWQKAAETLADCYKVYFCKNNLARLEY